MQNPLLAIGGSIGARFAPPLRFKPAGEISAAWACDKGPFKNVARLTGTPAQKAGKRYERRVLEELSGILGSEFTGSQWFRFTNASGTRYCQPDGLFLSENLTAIFEVKYRFVADAWWQLRRLYEPVVRRAYRPKRLALAIICKYLDPAIAFPEEINLCVDFKDGWEGDCHRIVVFPWKM